MEKPTLGRSEVSYPPPRSDVRLSYTFYRCFGFSESRISSEAVQIHVCARGRSSHELTLFGGWYACGNPHLQLLAMGACSRTAKKEKEISDRIGARKGGKRMLRQ